MVTDELIEKAMFRGVAATAQAVIDDNGQQ
jgi:hypothetical protein